MFSVEERDAVRRRLLELAEADPAVPAAAITGSHAAAAADRWSDIDLALAVDGPLDVTMPFGSVVIADRGCWRRHFVALHRDRESWHATSP